MDEVNHKNLDTHTQTKRKKPSTHERLIPSSNKFKLFYGVSFSWRERESSVTGKMVEMN